MRKLHDWRGALQLAGSAAEAAGEGEVEGRGSEGGEGRG